MIRATHFLRASRAVGGRAWIYRDMHGFIGTDLLLIQKEISRLDYLIDQNYQKLDTQKKTVMDTLKIIARNVFYKTLDPFKEAYDNYRDDHEIFRNLTHSHGVLIEKDCEVEVHLYPTYNYPPKLAEIFRTVLEGVNRSKPPMPDGSGRTLILKLGSKKGFQLGNTDPSN